MDCVSVQRILDTFADGELDAEQAVQVREHLRGCHGCRDRVETVRALKTALNRSFANIQAPQALRQQILQSADVPAVSPDPSATRHIRAPQRSWRNMVVPLALAATLVLIVTLWRQTPDVAPPDGTMSVVPARLVADVREQHRRCIRNSADGHHAADLPRSCPQIADKLSDDLQLAVLVPSLDAGGFAFFGADRCGIRGRPGAHVLYQSASSETMLSFFTVGRWVEVEVGLEDRKVEGLKREYVVSAKESPCVVAWHDGPQSYILCADLTQKSLIAVADGIRVAVGPAAGVERFAFHRGYRSGR